MVAVSKRASVVTALVAILAGCARQGGQPPPAGPAARAGAAAGQQPPEPALPGAEAAIKAFKEQARAIVAALPAERRDRLLRQLDRPGSATVSRRTFMEYYSHLDSALS